jgi:hypothetical protein
MGAEIFTERIRQIRTLAYELLARHGLNDWTFAFNRRKRSLGLCLYHLRTIELSAYLVKGGSPEEILDTILPKSLMPWLALNTVTMRSGNASALRSVPGPFAAAKRTCPSDGGEPVAANVARTSIGIASPRRFEGGTAGLAGREREIWSGGREFDMANIGNHMKFIVIEFLNSLPCERDK